MEEIQLDYATLVSVYQARVNDLINQIVVLEAKNIILSKKLQELSRPDNSSEFYDSSTAPSTSSTRKKTQTSDT